MSVFGIADADIANQAIDYLGHTVVIGDLQEGTRESQIMLRHYTPSIQEMLRSAHWNFARRQAKLTLLQDASGNTAGAGTGTPGQGLWVYEYAWPIDCLKARYVPVTGSYSSPVPTGNITSGSTVPQTTLPSAWPMARTIPAPFQVTVDEVPNFIGAITNWNQLPDLSNAQGQALTRQMVILTNQQNASLVYTAMISEPNIWDPLFRQAVVSLLAAKTAMAILGPKDPKLALAMRGQAIASARSALDAARVADGNEGPTNVNRDAQWITGRSSGGWGAWGWGGGYAGPGSLWGGWESCPFPDGSAY